MSEGTERTEKATPKKRKDAREKGQVLKSVEVNVAFSCAVMFGLLLIIGPSFIEKLLRLYTEYLSTAAVLPASVEVGGNDVAGAFMRALRSLAGLMLPIFLAAMLAGLASNILQVGFLFTTKPLQPKLERINPIKGFKRIFSARTLAELVKAVLKITILGYLVYGEYKKLVEKFPLLMGLELYATLMWVLKTALMIALKVSLALVAIAVADFLFQWWKFEKDLRMTKQEVKDEYRLMEGDPQIKGKIRQKQRQMSAMRMMEKVPSADVVITNPTHFAVALKYEEGVNDAPVVVAKGQDFLARKIRETARENRIEIVENKPLAQSLYASCEVGDVIPPELYQAVADILVYIYRQKNPPAAPRPQ